MNLPTRRYIMGELQGRKDMDKGSTTKHSIKHPTEAEQEIELICTIIRNGYHLGLNNHNRLSPRERFQFAVKLEEICGMIVPKNNVSASRKMIYVHTSDRMRTVFLRGLCFSSFAKTFFSKTIISGHRRYAMPIA